MLSSRWDLEGATVADLFAGTGALGIEALSRGAGRVFFVEKDQAALASLRANLAALDLDRPTEAGAPPRAVVVARDVWTWVGSSQEVDVAMADPPYSFSDWRALLESVPASIAACESSSEIPAPAGWEVLRSRRYGATVVTLVVRDSLWRAE